MCVNSCSCKVCNCVLCQRSDWIEVYDPWVLKTDGSLDVPHKTRGGRGEIAQLRRKPKKRKSTRRGRRRP